MEQKSTIFYRPIWTVGRYDAPHHVAIYYNNISGFSFFFESYSADVVGLILAAGRNGEVSISNIALATGISEESIVPFFETLINNGLLVSHIPTEEEIVLYRTQCATLKRNNQSREITTKEKLPIMQSSAESSYCSAIAAKGIITSVMFELTYNCSVKCIHCYNPGATRNDEEDSHRGDRNEMQLNDYKRVIDQLYNSGLIRITLSGGDPFSKPIAWEIIDYLYQKDIAFDIFTNGQQLVDKVDRLANYYPHIVGISIYSGIAEDHDAITRVKGSWSRSMDVVKQLSNLSVPLEIKCCIMQPNLHSYYMVNDIARQLGAQPQYEVNISDSNEGDRCARQLRLTEEQLQIVLRDNNVPMYVGPEAPNYGGQPKTMNETPCGAGMNSFCITPEGFLRPCCAFPLNLGNVCIQSIQQILTNNKELESWNNTILNEYTECGKHEYCDYCNLCSGNNQMEHGDFRKPAENCCYMAKVRYNLAHKMMDGYDPLQGKEFVTVLQELPKAKVDLRRIYDTKG